MQTDREFLEDVLAVVGPLRMAAVLLEEELAERLAEQQPPQPELKLLRGDDDA